MIYLYSKQKILKSLALSVFVLFFSAIFCVHNKTRSSKHYRGSSITSKRTSSLNRIVRDITLFPINGPSFHLSELKHTKAIVIIMREKDCPVYEKYGPLLVDLETEYSKKGVHFIYNYVGQFEREKNAREDLKKFGFKGSYIIDKKQILISALDAKNTGEVFVLTPKRRIIFKSPLYDTQISFLKSRTQPQHNYLEDVLKSMVADNPIAPKTIVAPGHIIKRPVIKEKIFWNNVMPIIKKKCVICHNPSGSGPIDYLYHEDIIGRQAMFRYVIENDLMPPWNLDPNTGPWEHDFSLTVREKAILLKWIDSGAKLPPSTYTYSDKIKNQSKISSYSDYIISLPEKITIPPGAGEYKRFFFKTQFKEDKWIKNIKFVLKPKVIHHSFLSILNSSFDQKNKTNPYKYMLTKISQGSRSILSDQIGVKIPKNSTIYWEIHYEPIGQTIADKQSHVRIHFNKKTPKYKLVNLTLRFEKINIPPHKSNYQTKMSHKVKETLLIKAMSTHMHLRGKSSSIFIIDPQGRKQKIFEINPWNIKFERSYVLKKTAYGY